ncbi:MAG: hypothetical protein JO002_13685, partial [Burkholderiaceae bacterium]|nr:hypothetical protein [Burkholderiaceae bacterium]
MRNWIKQLFPSNGPLGIPNAPLDLAQSMQEGNVSLEQGNFTDAAMHFRRVTAIEDTHALAYCKLGFALKELAQLGEAKSALLRAAAIDP